eukprot:5648841-Amphidinium_carterae.1
MMLKVRCRDQGDQFSENPKVKQITKQQVCVYAMAAMQCSGTGRQCTFFLELRCNDAGMIVKRHV